MVKPSPVKLMADAMLGKLGKFMRLLGFDTQLADVGWPDDDIWEIVLEKKQILLTRDHPFYERAQISLQKKQKDAKYALYLPSQDLVGQLAGVFPHLGLDPSDYFWEGGEFIPWDARCTLCNGKAVEVPKDTILDKIPPQTAKYFTRFWKCSNEACDKVYWIGKTHWDDISNVMHKVAKLIEENSIH